MVYAIQDVCDARDVPHPILMSESGRAMTAHHSVLVVETLGAFQKDNAEAMARTADRTCIALHRTCAEILELVCVDNAHGEIAASMN